MLPSGSYFLARDALVNVITLVLLILGDNAHCRTRIILRQLLDGRLWLDYLEALSSGNSTGVLGRIHD